MPKRSRLAKKTLDRISNGIRKPDPKSVREMTIRKPDGPAFGCLLYLDWLFVSGCQMVRKQDKFVRFFEWLKLA